MPSEHSVSGRVGAYLAFTFALSSYFYFVIIRAGSLGSRDGLWVLGLMWCPAAAAVLASLLTGRRLAAIGWRWSWRYALLAYSIPVAYGLMAYGVTWLLGLGRFPNPEFVAALSGSGSTGEATRIAKFALFQGSVGVLFSCVSGLGEEIGWRGFLVPELARTLSFPRVALLSGAIWSVWHYPILLFADYNGGTPAVYSLACFTALVLAISFVFAWIRLKSGSVWPAAILHGSHNLWIQQIFDPLTADTGRTRWIIGEFGAALAIVAILGVGAVSLLGRRRGGSIPNLQEAR